MEKLLAFNFSGNRALLFDGHRYEFDPDYFALAGEELEQSYQSVFAGCVRQWRIAIEALKELGDAAYLPVGVYDQSLECFVATIKDSSVVMLHSVWLLEDGHALFLNDIGGFVNDKHEIVNTGPNIPRWIGNYDRDDLIAALDHFEGQTFP